MKKFDLSMLTIAILVLALVIVGVALKPADDPVIATTGKSQITQGQLYEHMKESYGKQTLGILVSRNLVVEEAKELGVSVQESEVDQEINKLKEQIGSEEVYQKTLKRQGYTEASFRGTLRTLLLRDKVFAKAYPVTDEEIQDYYNKYKSNFGDPAPALEQLRPTIVEELNASKRKKYMDEWLDGLEKKFGVQYLDPSLSLKKEEPKAEEQKTEASKKEEPKTEAPKTETQKTETPKTEAPKSN